nr:hypothetical protein BaRGS_010251 [Batillaria attramentaria]
MPVDMADQSKWITEPAELLKKDVKSATIQPRNQISGRKTTQGELHLDTALDGMAARDLKGDKHTSLASSSTTTGQTIEDKHGVVAQTESTRFFTGLSAKLKVLSMYLICK